MLILRLKYDLKALFRVTWPLYVAIIVMSFGIYVYEMIQNWDIFNIALFDMFVGIYSFVYVIALMGLIIWPIIVCIRDFFNTMLKDEGYLTNTLPVSRNILILSKELAGLIFFLISCILLIISLFAVVMPSISLMDIGRVFVGYHWDWQSILLFVMLMIMGLVSAYSSITLFVLAMMLGQMHRSAKGIFSVAYYFLISFGMQILILILTIAFGFVMDTEIGWHIGNSFYAFMHGHEFITAMIVMGLGSLYNLAVGIIFHSISVWIANHKLNLE